MNTVCGVIEPGLAKNLAALNILALDAAQKRADIVARLPLVQELPEHLDARNVVLVVGRMPTISTSSPTFTIPRSTRPVTTVPRPEIENTSSIGIRKGWSIGRSGWGIYSSNLAHQLQDRVMAELGSCRLPTPSARIRARSASRRPGTGSSRATRALPSPPGPEAPDRPPCRTCS